MDDTKTPRMGRRPKLSETGARLAKIAIKVYLDEWEAYGEIVGAEARSENIRRHMQQVIRSARRKR